MKTRTYFIVVLIGIIFEYILRVIFVEHPVILVPELLIFLSIIDIKSKDLLTKLVVAAVIYDLWMSPQVGLFTLALIVMFLVLYVFAKISYLDRSNIQKNSYTSGFMLTILSECLFLLYYLFLYISDKMYLTLYGISQTNWSWRLSFWSNLPSVVAITTLVFLFLFFGYSYSMKPKRFKI